MAIRMIWNVWDFPDTIYVKFLSDFRKQLYTKLIERFGSRNKAAKFLGIHTTSLRDTIQRAHDSEGLEVYTKIRTIKKLIEIFPEIKYVLGKNIIAYRSFSGNSVYYPIIPIKESPELYSIVAHMVCDGSATKRKSPAYYNTSKELREGFKKNLQIFGKVKTNEYILQNSVYSLLFPKVITDILSHIFKIEFVRTKKLPEMFFNASKECQYAAIRAMFDDEGSVSSSQLRFSQKQIGIIKDLKRLLEVNNIKCGKIYEDHKKCHTITVLSESRQRFNEIIGFSHSQKSIMLNKIASADRIRYNRPTLISQISDLFEKQQNLTRTDISRKLNANVNSVTEILYRLKKDGKIKSKYVRKNKPYIWSRVYDE